MATKVGEGRCPVCGSPKARFSLSKKDLICVTCDACNVQVFARSGRSDELLRDHIKPAEPDQVPDLAPAAPASGSPGEPPAAVTEKPTPSEKRRSLMSW